MSLGGMSLGGISLDFSKKDFLLVCSKGFSPPKRLLLEMSIGRIEAIKAIYFPIAPG
jgi:hypothetical protein